MILIFIWLIAITAVIFVGKKINGKKKTFISIGICFCAILLTLIFYGPGFLGALFLVAILALVIGVPLIFFYMLPTYIATRKQHINKSAIMLVNILFGWTALGWIAALIWAFTNSNKSNISDSVLCLKCGCMVERTNQFCPNCGNNIYNQLSNTSKAAEQKEAEQ